MVARRLERVCTVRGPDGFRILAVQPRCRNGTCSVNFRGSVVLGTTLPCHALTLTGILVMLVVAGPSLLLDAGRQVLFLDADQDCTALYGKRIADRV